MEDILALALQQHLADISTADSDRKAKCARTGAKHKSRSATKRQTHRTALSNDEGSLVAFGITMFKNGGRTLALYDEGDGLFKALRTGVNGSFSPSTMAKLHNGNAWNRDVVNDMNKFRMPRTTFNIVMAMH